MAAQASGQIDTVMHETRVFPPPAEFAARARIKSLAEYQALWDKAAADPAKFWAEAAREELHWFRPFTQALEWNEPYAQWFVGGRTNASYNCLDRHIVAGLGERTAIFWEGEPGDWRQLTYAELHRDVCKFANALKTLGIVANDRVSIYMPMVPELAIAMLACADRGDSFGDLCGLLGGGDRGAKSRRGRQANHHGGRELASRQGAAAQADGRRGAGQVAVGREVHRARSRERGSRDEARPRLLVARVGEKRVGPLPRDADGERSTALHPLHERFDRQAKGNQTHDGRLQSVREEDF